MHENLGWAYCAGNDFAEGWILGENGFLINFHRVSSSLFGVILVLF